MRWSNWLNYCNKEYYNSHKLHTIIQPPKFITVCLNTKTNNLLSERSLARVQARYTAAVRSGSSIQDCHNDEKCSSESRCTGKLVKLWITGMLVIWKLKVQVQVDYEL